WCGYRISVPLRTCIPCGAGTACVSAPCPCRSVSSRRVRGRRRIVLVQMASLYLHAVKTVVVRIVHIAGGPPFAGLALRRKAALDAAPLRFGPPFGLGPLDDFFLVVDANDHVP